MKERIIPKTLLNLISERGLTKTEVAFRAGIDLSRFSRISNGWLVPNENERERISSFFELSENKVFPEFLETEGN